MPDRVTRTYTRTYTRRKLFGGRVTRTQTKTWVKDKKPTVLRVQVPLTGRDLLEMERLKQEQRAVRAAQREARRQEFQAWWKDAQARQREYAVQRAEHLKQIAPQVAQLRQDARDAHATYMASLNKAALWLHTRVGAVTCLALFGLAFIASFATGLFIVPMALAVALAVADGHNLGTLHGRIPWRAWILSHPVLTGCLALIMVACYYVIVVWYLIENLRLAPTVGKLRHESIRENIARMERDLFPDLPTM